MAKKKNYSAMYTPEDECADCVIELPDEVAETPVADETIVCPAEHVYVKGFVTNCARLNVREHPSTDAKVVCVLPLAAELSVCTAHNHDDWFEVCTATGVEGYCMKQFINV